MLQDSSRTDVSIFPTRREIAGRIFRQRRVFWLVFGVVVAGFIFTGQFRPKYLARMTMLVLKQRVDPVVTAGENDTPQLQSMSVNEEDLNSETEMLKSSDLLHDVVLQADLVPQRNESPAAIEKAVRKLEHQLEVAVLPKTNLISLHYESSDPEQSQRVLQALSTLYLRKQRSVTGPDFQVGFFTKQVQEHGNALRQSENNLIDFTQRTGIVSADLERDLTVRRMEEVRQASVQNAAETAAAIGRTGKLAQLVEAEPERLDTEKKAADNPQLLDQLNVTLLTLQLKRTDLLSKFDAKYRLVQDVDREIATTESMIKAQLASPTREQTSSVNPSHLSLETAYATSQADLTALRSKQRSLQSSAVAVKKQAEALAAKEAEQEALLRDVKTKRDEYQLYVDKLEQARLTQSLDQGGILNVAVAEPPSLPALPQNSSLKTLLAMLFAALVLGTGAALLADFLDPTVRSARELEEVLGIPLLAEFESFTT